MEFLTLRPSVQSFANDMERILRLHDDKGGWQDTPVDYLLERLHEELQELQEAIDNKMPSAIVLDEAVDVGNFAMMIASKAYRGDL